MEKVDVVVGKPGSQMQSSAAKGGLAHFRQNWDWLAIVLLAILSIPLPWLSPRSLTVVTRPMAFDYNWVLDSAFAASRGIWFGSGIIFQYGPLFQWIWTAPARWTGLSMGTVYATWRDTSLLWFSLLLLYLTVRWLLPKQPAWKRFLLLLLLPVFWLPWDGRTILNVFLFVAFLRGWYGVRERWYDPVVVGGVAALLSAAAFLYSADAGIYAVAALLIALAGVAWEGRWESQAFRRYAVALFVFAVLSGVLVFVINAGMTKPLDFRYWKSSMAIVNLHRWKEPAPMTQDGEIRLLVTLIAGGIVFLVRRLAPDKDQFTARTGFLLSAFVFGLLAMQTGLVRSDDQHIVFAIFPMVLFVAAVLFSFTSPIISTGTALAVIVCSAMFAQPATVLQPSMIRFRLAQLRDPLISCPTSFQEFDRACFPTGFTGMLQTVSGYLQQHSGLQDSVVIFPYQYMLGMASGRNVASGVMQANLASGPYLSQVAIAGMERVSAPVGLYFPDGNLSFPIDEVSNFTRTPDVWFWVLRHFRSQEEIVPGVFGLQRDDSRAPRISMQAQPLLVAARRYGIAGRSTSIDLGDPVWPVDGGDFLHLRLNVHYGFLLKLCKPERLQLEITRADGSRDLRAFVVEPNVPSEVWVYPWADSGLSGYFGAEETQWRSGPRPSITHLRLFVTPVDWVSQQADSIVVESAEAVKLSMASNEGRSD
jgi:hypothetical protein